MSINKAKEYAALSPCKKRKVGAVVIDKYGEVVAYGYNHGWFEECNCSVTEKNPHVYHAEEMALAAKKSEYEDCTIFVTYPPCDKCQVLIKQKNVKCFYLDRSGKECKL